MEDEEAPLASWWTLGRLRLNQARPEWCPDLPTVERLIEEYSELWTPRHVPLDGLLPWLLDEEHLQLPSIDFTWEAYTEHFELEEYRLQRLRYFFECHRVTSGEHYETLRDVARVLYNLKPLVREATILYNNLSPSELDRRAALPEELRHEDKRQKVTETIDEHDPSKSNSFQNAFLSLRYVLLGMQYRRAGGSFFRRVVTDAGLPTLAFQEVCTIERFVAEHTSPNRDFECWKWVTNPPSTVAHLVEYLKKADRRLPEAPDLVENPHLRSYAGDAVGRGAGVYDSQGDFFFPYHCRDRWDELAAEACATRARFLGADYALAAPRAEDVCVVHLEASFPFDLVSEVREVEAELGWLWRRASAYECSDARYELPADVGEMLVQLFEEGDEDAMDAAVVGLSWQRALCVLPEGWTRLSRDVHTALHDALLDEGRMYFTREELSGWPPLHGQCYVEDDESGHIYVPHVEPARQRRVRVPSLPSGNVSHRSFARGTAADGSAVWFRMHLGRTWRDCEVSEIDHIYHCQHFTEHDIFMIYALKGRLFFEVKERDNFEITLFFEGVGGCGKSTVLRTQMAFWPAHRRGVLSSNMQTQFGMSSVAHGDVVFCNEVCEELNVVQEEWQGACSGEELSLAVKFKEPMVLRWKAQFFWVGNAFPEKWKNTQRQVTRRLAGVLMAFPVRPRRGDIMDILSTKLGALQRKEILAYDLFLDVCGTTDPMSVPHALPPAFRDYFARSTRKCNPMEDFLSEGTYVREVKDASMLMDTFKELYNRYRIKHDLGRSARWSEDLYRTSFNDRGIFVRKNVPDYNDGDMDHHNVTVVYNLMETGGR